MWNSENFVLLFFFLNIVVLMFNLTNFLSFLVCLEFFILNIFVSLTMLNYSFDISLNMFLLVLAASEATMGLSMLVSEARLSGGELFLSSSFSQCEGF